MCARNRLCLPSSCQTNEGVTTSVARSHIGRCVRFPCLQRTPLSMPVLSQAFRHPYITVIHESRKHSHTHFRNSMESKARSFQIRVQMHRIALVT